MASTTITPTGRMVGRVATADLDPTPLVDRARRPQPAEHNRYVDASRLTTGLLGDAVTANVFLLGVAYQAGVVPVKAASIEAAIDLNGTAVELNLQAFRWGRLWVVDPSGVERQAGVRAVPPAGTAGLEDLGRRRRAPAHGGRPAWPSSPPTRTAATPTATWPWSAAATRPSGRPGATAPSPAPWPTNSTG